jgi:hypothetical protein
VLREAVGEEGVIMATVTTGRPSEMAILRRVVDRKHSALSQEAAGAILRLDFDATDRKRMNDLAAKNRAGRLTPLEEAELDNFIHVGQMLGILKSKARKALKTTGA